MQRLAFLLIFIFSSTSLSAGNEDVSLSAHYVKGSWAPDFEVPSDFYDVPGDRNTAATGQAGISVDDVFAENDKPLTEDSFKAMATEVAKNSAKKKAQRHKKISRKKRK